MKIIFLTQLFPIPLDSGNKIIAFKMLNILSRKHDVYFLAFTDGDKNNLKRAKLLPKIKYSYTENKDIIFNKHKLTGAFTFLFSLFLLKPYIVIKYHSRNMQEQIEKLIKEEKIQKKFICNDTMMQYIPSWYGGNVIYTSIDLTSSLYQQYANFEHNLLKKLVFLWESYKLKQYENKILHRADIIFSISTTELEKIKIIVGSKKIVKFLPIPFKLHKRNLNINDPNILFIGGLTWRPNYDGLWWFLKEIFPSVIKAIPKAKLLVGSNDSFNLDNYEYRNHIILIRNVIHNNSISNDLYAKSKIFIVPIRFGSGIRIKLLDALSHGIPVVSTTKGAEGIGVKKDKELIIANSPSNFALGIIKIIQNKNLSSLLSRNGLLFIQKYYCQKKTENALKVLNSI